ncbi:MAG: hypothetical protein ACI845_001653 [Gammaproteobacteria bacterium]|jgi:hypothetical protein
MGLNKAIALSVFFLITSCATPPTVFENLKIEVSAVYRFNNPTLNTNLYLKFLPIVEDEPPALIIKTISKNQSLNGLEQGLPGVHKAAPYHLTERGKLVFNLAVPGLYEEVLRYHQYSNYGVQQDEITLFRYRLNLLRSEVLQ